MLQDGKPKNSGFTASRDKSFLFFKASRPAMGPTLSPVHQVPGVLPRDKIAGL